MRALLISLLALVACGREPRVELDYKEITVEGAHMRTDTVGDERFSTTATFVLVDARNNATQGAYVTLDGQLLDAGGGIVGELLPQVLWIPPGEARTYALVDSEGAPRPSAKSARARVRAAAILAPPLAHLEEVHQFDDHGKPILQAYLVNDADRDGYITVIAAFHDERGRPMTRPFQVLKVKRKQEPVEVGRCPDMNARAGATSSKCVVQFVGPAGAKHASLFIGETVY